MDDMEEAKNVEELRINWKQEKFQKTFSRKLSSRIEELKDLFDRSKSDRNLFTYI